MTTAARPSPNLIRNQGYWVWSIAVLAFRLPATMAPLAFTVLSTAMVGSYRFGALMMAAYVVGELLAAVPVGRLLDAVGPARGLRVLLPVSAALFGGVWLAADARTSQEVLMLLVVVCGVTSGGLGGGFRALLADTVTDSQLTRATAVDAMAMDGVIIAGPVLVALAASGGPTVPLVVMAGAFLLSSFLVRGRAQAHVVPADEEVPPPAGGRYWGPALCWFACMFAIGHLLSTLEVAPLPLAERLGGSEGTAALLVGVLSGASIVGGALFVWRGRPTITTAMAFLACYVVGACLVAYDLGWSGLLIGLILVGSCTGPLLSVASVNLQRILPRQRKSTGFSVAYIIQSAGFGLGALSLAWLPLTAAVLAGGASSVIVLLFLAHAALRGEQSDAAAR